MMKKVLMMTAITAMAFGAQAGYAYTWSVDMNNLPSKYNYSLTFPSDLTAYLVDTSSTDGQGRYKVLAYVSTSDIAFKLDPNEQGKITGAVTVGSATVERNSLPRATNYFYMEKETTMKISEGGLTLTVGDDSKNPGKYKDHFSTAYTSSVSLDKYYEDRQGDNLDPVLKTVLFSEKDGLYQVLDVNWAGDSTLQSSAAFKPVPEPTSGMLVFLGFAGLMLKRKRAA